MHGEATELIEPLAQGGGKLEAAHDSDSSLATTVPNDSEGDSENNLNGSLSPGQPVQQIKITDGSTFGSTVANDNAATSEKTKNDVDELAADSESRSETIDDVLRRDADLRATVAYLRGNFRKVLAVFPGSEPGVPLAELLQEALGVRYRNVFALRQARSHK